MNVTRHFMKNTALLLSSLTVIMVATFGHVALRTQMDSMDHMSGKQVTSQGCQLICGGFYAEKEKLLLSFEDNKIEPLPPLFSIMLRYSSYSFLVGVSVYSIAYRYKIPRYRWNQCLRM